MFEAINNSTFLISENIIDPKVIEQSETVYSLRNKLVQEALHERREETCRKENEEYKVKQEEKEIQTSADILAELVVKIENMGWEVTLRRKQLQS